ncbi:hypothetical protein CR513_32171, partial [Mucuna pruriens]
MLSFFPYSPLMLNLPSCVFRCVAFVHSHNPHREKLDPRAVKCVFIGYPSNKKGFKCYRPPSRCSLSQWMLLFMNRVVLCQPSTSKGELSRMQEGSYQEIESIIESLPFPTQDVQVQEVTKPTLVPQQVQLSKLEVNILENPIEDVTDNIPIAFGKGK